MPLSPGFADYAEELLVGFGKVEIRRMFGGAAIYRNGIGFGILDDDVFYLKADAEFGAELKQQGCRPWIYSVKKDGAVRDIAYWSMPAAAADDPDEASSLARRSYQIAVKAAADKRKKAKKPAPSKKATADTTQKAAARAKAKK